MIFAAFRALAVHAAQLRATLTPRTIAEAADEHWAQATRTRDGAQRLADAEAAEEVSEPSAEQQLVDAWWRGISGDATLISMRDEDQFFSATAPDRPVPGIAVYPPSNPSNHESSCVDGEAATVVGPPMQGSPAASVSADPDAAGLPALTRDELYDARHAVGFAREHCTVPIARDRWWALAERLGAAADALK